MTFAEELKLKRLELGLTQKQMAKKCGVSLSTYKNLEIYNGSYGGSFPSATTIRKLKRYGILDLSYLEAISIIRKDRDVERRHHQYKNAGRPKKNEKQGFKDND